MCTCPITIDDEEQPEIFHGWADDNSPFSKYDPNSNLKQTLDNWRNRFVGIDDSNEAVDAFLEDIHSDELYIPKEDLFE